MARVLVYRRPPVTTISICRLPQQEHTGRSRHEVLKGKNMTSKYPALRVTAVIMKILGWISIISGIIVLLLLAFFGANLFTVIYLLAVAFGGLLWGILTIAGAEIIQVIIDIEQNTRTASKSIPVTDTAPNQQFDQSASAIRTFDDAREFLEMRDYKTERRVFGNKVYLTMPGGNKVSFTDEPQFIAWARQELKEKFDI
jgi:hypothetical protein